MDVYKKLAVNLDKLPEGFTSVKSGVELQILAKIFTEEEAAAAVCLTDQFQPAAEVAEKLGLDAKPVKKLLRGMGKKRIISWKAGDGRISYKLEPFIVGFYEEHRDSIDYELAHLVEHYFQEGGTEGIMKFSPALQRVIPSYSSIDKELVLPYDDIVDRINTAKSFLVYDCICRKQQDLLDKRECSFPLDVCLVMLDYEAPSVPGLISREAALEIVTRTEEIGLVHTVRNVISGVNYLCNCCGCCCGLLRGINEFGLKDSIASANYLSVIDNSLCTACGICVDRCQVHAIKIGETAEVDTDKCIGCGLCVSTCPSDAVSLIRKPAGDCVTPPADKEAWDQQRLISKGRDVSSE